MSNINELVYIYLEEGLLSSIGSSILKGTKEGAAESFKRIRPENIAKKATKGIMDFLIDIGLVSGAASVPAAGVYYGSKLLEKSPELTSFKDFQNFKPDDKYIQDMIQKYNLNPKVINSPGFKSWLYSQTNVKTDISPDPNKPFEYLAHAYLKTEKGLEDISKLASKTSNLTKEAQNSINDIHDSIKLIPKVTKDVVNKAETSINNIIQNPDEAQKIAKTFFQEHPYIALGSIIVPLVLISKFYKNKQDKFYDNYQQGRIRYTYGGY